MKLILILAANKIVAFRAQKTHTQNELQFGVDLEQGEAVNGFIIIFFF